MKPGSSELKILCEACIDIAHQTGEKILEIYQGEYSVEEKADKTPLTTADTAAHNIIEKALKKLTPAIPVLSEESEKIPFEIRQTWQTYWLVDPLDGTREFIKRNGEFTVNIALIHEHKSILGVIYAPVLDIDYFAWQAGGAFKSKQRQAPVKIHCRQPDINKLTIAGSRSHASPGLQYFIQQFENPEVMSMGSSLKSCLVAEGRADIYPRLGLTSEWDTAAAHCIVEEAGGQIVKTSMQPLLYNTKDSLLNPEFFVAEKNGIDWSIYLQSSDEE